MMKNAREDIISLILDVRESPRIRMAVDSCGGNFAYFLLEISVLIDSLDERIIKAYSNKPLEFLSWLLKDYDN